MIVVGFFCCGIVADVSTVELLMSTGKLLFMRDVIILYYYLDLLWFSFSEEQNTRINV